MLETRSRHGRLSWLVSPLDMSAYRPPPASGFPTADLLNEVCARAHGCDTSDLAWVNTLFVAAEARGPGIGRRLMQVVVGDVQRAGPPPCFAGVTDSSRGHVPVSHDRLASRASVAARLAARRRRRGMT
jgi:GNAT superfamily N-acetyltransferase